MKASTIFFIIAVLGTVAAIVYSKKNHETRHPLNRSQDERGRVIHDPGVDQAPAKEDPMNPDDSRNSKPATPVATTNEEEVVRAKFGQELRDLGTCLQVTNGLSDKANPTFENLNSSLRNAFGELVTTNEDWVDTQIQTAGGELRHIHIETDYADDNEPARSLRYYRVSAEGTQTPIPLDKDQRENPSDTFIAGLEKDGQVLMREKGIRAYYPNGDEVLFIERNGTMSDLEVTGLDGKKFKCTDLNNPQSSCTCL